MPAGVGVQVLNERGQFGVREEETSSSRSWKGKRGMGMVGDMAEWKVQVGLPPRELEVLMPVSSGLVGKMLTRVDTDLEVGD